MAKDKSFGQRVREEGGASVAGKGLGEMPLTLWLIVAAVILYLYIRRANLGIDKHPGEVVTVKPSVPFGPPAPVPGFTLPSKPTIQIPTTVPMQAPGVLQ